MVTTMISLTETDFSSSDEGGILPRNYKISAVLPSQMPLYKCQKFNNKKQEHELIQIQKTYQYSDQQDEKWKWSGAAPCF